MICILQFEILKGMVNYHKATKQQQQEKFSDNFFSPQKLIENIWAFIRLNWILKVKSQKY